MKRMMIRYKVKADRAAENQQYVEKVFEELRRKAPAGVRYATFKLSDGVSFVHLVSAESEEANNQLTQMAAFKAFQAGVNERCEEKPVLTELFEVGSYNFFDSQPSA